MDEGFEMLRSERRSFFCPNKLWKELEKKVGDCTSISTFIKLAIVEKMSKEDESNREVYESLLF